MKKDITMFNAFVFSVLLFGAGAIWSPILISVIGVTENIFSVLASIATIVAAVVAVIALNSWKRQFVTSRRYEELQSLRGALFSFYSSTHIFRVYGDFYGGGGVDFVMSASLEDEYEKSRDVWWQAVAIYTKQWRQCSPFLDFDLDSSLVASPENIRKIFRDLKKDLAGADDFGLIGEFDIVKIKLEELDKLLSDTDKILSELVSNGLK